MGGGAVPLFDCCLYQPQIPGNTGTIGRMCVGLGCRLRIVGPCAFDFSSHAVRRAGLDYWPDLDLAMHAGPEDFLAWLGPRRPWLLSEHGALRYDQADFQAGDAILFGNEVRGLPRDWFARWPERAVHLPILGPVRSYNLSNAASVVLMQACLRAGAFDGYRPPAFPDLSAAPSDLGY